MEIISNNILKIAHEVLDSEIQVLKNARDLIDNNFVNAVEILVHAKNIIITGIGKSGIIGKKIAATMTSTGSPAIFLHPVEALHGDLGIVRHGDAALVLSKSGATSELISLIPFLKSRNIPIVSIVGNINSYIAEQSDAVLNGTVEREACPYNLAPTSSTTLALALGDALAIACMKVKKFEQKDFSLLHPNGQLGRNLILKVKDVMHSGNQLPIIDKRGSFRDAVIEITDKGLGCVCITDESMKLTGILTDGDVRRTLQKFEDLRGLSVVDVMTSDPISISGDLLLGDALAVMENRASQISVLPVIDNDRKCIGVIRIHDIIKKEI